EVAWKLVAPVDLGRARGDLVRGEIVDGLANRVRSLAQIEIEDPIGVSDHGVVSPANQTVFETALFARIALVTGRTGAVRGIPACDALTQGKVVLAHGSARGCNSRQIKPSRPEPKEASSRHREPPMHGTIDRAEDLTSEAARERAM